MQNSSIALKKQKISNFVLSISQSVSSFKGETRIFLFLIENIA